MNIPYFKQEVDYFCGPASLQMAFAFFGKTISQTEIASQAGTTKEEGTDNDKLVKVAQEAGFRVSTKELAALEDIQSYLTQNIPVIVNFIEPTDEEGHYAVVVGIDDKDIILNDPWNGPNFSIPKADFVNRWHSTNNQHTRWLMTVSHEQP